MVFFSKVGGAVTGLTGAGVAGYGLYKMGTDNTDQALTTGNVAKGVYDSTDNMYEAAGAGLMEAYFQDRDFNENFGRNLGLSALGIGLIGAAANEFTDVNQYLSGRAQAEE